MWCCSDWVGRVTPVRAALVAQHYGTVAYGPINGALTMIGTWARAAPVGVGALSVAIGYRPLLCGLAVVAAVAAGCVWRAVPASKRIERTKWSLRSDPR